VPWNKTREIMESVFEGLREGDGCEQAGRGRGDGERGALR
jgi:hypothetical protein